MKPLLALFCLALFLAGCRAAPQAGFFQTRIPPPGTQPNGSLLADNVYYPGGERSAASPTADAAPPSLAPTTKTNIFTPVERRGASLGRAASSTSRASGSAAGREEPIRIAENTPLPSGLAAVVPIRGVPTTDVTGLFQTVRSSLNPPSADSLLASASGYIEISQLPDPPVASRRAARSSQPLR